MQHAVHDLVSVELAKRVADGLPMHPEWLDLARENLRRWLHRNADSPGLIRCYREWFAILDRSLDEIRAVLTEGTDEGQRLRQNSPFVGVLSPSEVWEIKHRVRNEATGT